MNAIFGIITALSCGITLIISPESILPSMTIGVEKAIKLSGELLVVYALWLGLYEIAESCGISRLTARFLKKPIRFIFGICDEKSIEAISMNVSANLLGLSSVATPLGIKACSLLEEKNERHAQNVLLVVASSSLQLLPTSVISLRGQYGSVSSGDIILPTLLSTLVSTLTGIILIKIFDKK